MSQELSKEQRQKQVDQMLFGNLENKQRADRVERGARIIRGFINRGIAIQSAK